MQIGLGKGFQIISNAPQQSFIDDIIYIVDRHNSCKYFDPRAKMDLRNRPQ